MNTFIIDIAKVVNESDVVLNQAIQSFIDGPFYNGPVITAAQWRIDNYAILRKWAYPDITVFNDAMVKINSDDSVLETQGNSQLAQYYADCLAVKARFPKEVSDGN